MNIPSIDIVSNFVFVSAYNEIVDNKDTDKSFYAYSDKVFDLDDEYIYPDVLKDESYYFDKYKHGFYESSY